MLDLDLNLNFLGVSCVYAQGYNECNVIDICGIVEMK
jgi:hypothetical protein